jgi:predicted nucleic acid-binding protein
LRQGRVFVDTNVLLYMFDPADESKRLTALRVVRDLGARVTVSTQVLQEFFWVATRKLGIGAQPSREFVHELCEGEVVSATPVLVADAIDLSIVTGYSLWDSLIIQAAIAGRCEVLLTEDLDHGRVVKGVRIQNPFVQG